MQSDDLQAITVGIREARAMLEHHSKAAIECGVLLGQLLTAAKAETGILFPVVLHKLNIDQPTARQWIALAKRKHKNGVRMSEATAR